jgi:hypothetical protein
VGPGAPGALWEERADRWLARPWLQAATAAVPFAVVALVSGSQLWANWVAAGLDVPWRSLVTVRLVDWGLWVVAVPGVVALDGLLRRRAPPWYAVAGTHLLAATAWFALQNVVPVLLAPRVDPFAVGQPFWDAYLARGLVRLSTAWVVYGSVLAVVALLRDFVRRQRLTRDLWDAQLRALRAQIQPHFLFNTLHTVGALVRTGDREEAIATLVALSELLRRSLGSAREDVVPLEEELDFLDTYLAIQRARFGDRLQVATRVAPEARGALVPPLLLQPLVENAIRHGLDLDRGPGTVCVGVAVDGPWLRLSVEDDGGAPDDEIPAPEDDDDEGGGIGLSNLRDRLARLYGPDQALELTPTHEGGTVATVRIPRGRPHGP